MKKYLVLPGKVRSANDKDIHHISASQLMELYGVPLDECVIMPSSGVARGIDPSVLIHLHPRRNGDYTLPTKVGG